MTSVPASCRISVSDLTSQTSGQSAILATQVSYSDPDSGIRKASKMMCALAFVPVDDVLSIFDELFNEISDDFVPMAVYFEVISINEILIYNS